jgi:hypothetical protein
VRVYLEQKANQGMQSLTETSLDVDMRAYTLAAAVNQRVVNLTDLTFVKPIARGSPVG